MNKNAKINNVVVCGNCHNIKFEVRYVVWEGIKSIVIHCNCGRVVEYRDFQHVINATPKIDCMR